jgi:hypothetical protein
MFYLAFGKFKVDVYNPKEVIFDAKAEYVENFALTAHTHNPHACVQS